METQNERLYNIMTLIIGDIRTEEDYLMKYILFTAKKINACMGLNVSDEDITTIIEQIYAR